MINVAIVVGTRPEAIKLLPVHAAFRRSSRLSPLLVSTGQHREMLDSVLQLFDVRPDVELSVMTAGQTLHELTARLLVDLVRTFSERRVDAVVVQGDTTTCFVAALAAFYTRAKVIHVEAGLRTNDRYSPYPEEMNRRLTDVLSDLYFPPTARAAQALEREGITAGVHVVGNTVIDSLLLVRERVRARRAHYDERFAASFAPGEKVVLVTGHRRESFGKGFQDICDALERLARTYPDVRFVYPVHLNPNVHDVVHARLAGVPNVVLLDPLPYDELVHVLDRSWIVLTDSGGIQEEAPALGKPVVVMRENTERPEAVDAGCAILAGNTTDGIVNAFRAIADDPARYRAMSIVSNPYGDGTAAEAIRRACEAAL